MNKRLLFLALAVLIGALAGVLYLNQEKPTESINRVPGKHSMFGAHSPTEWKKYLTRPDLDSSSLLFGGKSEIQIMVANIDLLEEMLNDKDIPEKNRYALSTPIYMLAIWQTRTRPSEQNINSPEEDRRLIKAAIAALRLKYDVEVKVDPPLALHSVEIAASFAGPNKEITPARARDFLMTMGWELDEKVIEDALAN